MKKITAMLLLLAMVLSLGTVSAETSALRLGGLKGATTMGLVKLLEDNEAGTTQNKYDFTMAVTADELTPKLLKGEMDILAVPANLAAVLYNNTKGQVKLLAVGALGVLYIVEKGGDSVQSIADLKGKTIYSTGKGTTPEMSLTYLLAQNGLDINTDVTMEWMSEPTETVARLNAQEQGVAMLPQPFATVALQQVEGLRTALSLEEEWNKLDNGSRLTTAVVIVRSEFADKNPEAVANFLKDYEASVAWINANVAEAAKLVDKQGIVKAPIAEKALPLCNLVALSGADMRAAAEGYLQTLFDQKPQAVGGQMPADDFYYGAP